MTYLVEVPLNNEASVVMEVDAAAEDDVGIVRSARPGEVLATVTKSLDAAMDTFRPMAQTMMSKLRDSAESPDEIAIEFGLKMTVAAGLVVAHSGGEANFKVNLRWNRR
jgi:Trypsin-co-occurring domain 1